jgi:phosphotransferase system HPr (HPr) family protein
MKTITKSCIRLDARAEYQGGHAIRQAGLLLADAGYIQPAYIESLLKREQVANTFLGSGVAIPHGMIDDRHLIQHTGIAILQVPEGVEWNRRPESPSGGRHRRAIGRAHQPTAPLTRLMQQPRRHSMHSVHADNPLVLIDSPRRAHAWRSDGGRSAAPPWPADAEVELDGGLSQRPARPPGQSSWVDTAKRFTNEIRIYKDAEFADAKTLTDLLALGVTSGTALRLAARGPDAQRALNALLETVRGLSAVEKADAERARKNALAARKTAPEWTPSGGSPRTLYGLGASPGLAVGKLVRHVSQRIEVTDQPGDVVAEGEALEQALLAVRAEREELEGRTRQRLSAAEAAIFAAQRELLADPVLTRDALATIMQGHGAAWSWQRALQARIEKLQKVDDPLLAARAVDLRDVGERVFGQLLGIERKTNHPDRTVDSGGGRPDSHPTRCISTPVMSLGLGHQRRRPHLAHRHSGPHPGSCPPSWPPVPRLLAAPDGGTAVLDGGSGRLYLDVSEADQK